MKRWIVLCGYRTDDGLNYSEPTRWRPVEVEATDEGAARLRAIEKVYEELGGACSHVRPLSVVEIKRG